MCKKWGYYVRSVCALCCIFCMLFSNTLLVRAESTTYNVEKVLKAETSYYVTNSNSTVLQYEYSSRVNNIPQGWLQTWLQSTYTHDVLNYNLCPTVEINLTSGNLNEKGRLNFSSNYILIKRDGATASSSPARSSITNISLNRSDGTPIPFKILETNNRDYFVLQFSLKDDFVKREYISSTGTNTSRLTVPLKLNFSIDINTITDNIPKIVINAYLNSTDVTGGTASNGTLNLGVTDASDLIVSDSGTQHAVEEGNEIASDTNETTHSIFDSISDFFGSFFSNLIGVFVPESNYFSNWFSRLNTLLEAKLGILYWPFSKIISFLNRLSDSISATSDCIIKFPAIKFTNSATNETYTFLEEQTINLQTYNTSISLSGGSPNSSLVGSNRFNSLVGTIRSFNSFVLIFGLLSLLRKKLNLILRGDDNDN